MKNDAEKLSHLSLPESEFTRRKRRLRFRYEDAQRDARKFYQTEIKKLDPVRDTVQSPKNSTPPENLDEILVVESERSQGVQVMAQSRISFRAIMGRLDESKTWWIIREKRRGDLTNHQIAESMKISIT